MVQLEALAMGVWYNNVKRYQALGRGRPSTTTEKRNEKKRKHMAEDE